MTPFDYISARLRDGMVEGNMHICLRDTGRLAGGYAASGHLTAKDVFDLEQLAVNLSINPEEGRKKWGEFVVGGRQEPVKWENGNYRYNPSPGRELGWDDEIGGNQDNRLIVRKEWMETEEVIPPTNDEWDAVRDLTRYLGALFDSEDLVGYVTESWYNPHAQRNVPKQGVWDRTAGQLINALGRCNGDIANVVGDWTEEVGAWIRFNPLDGLGVKDANVTAFRYALVESDKIEIKDQRAILKELDLPIAALVHSGRKSLHAIVRIDAVDFQQYRERVDFLYDVCKRNGLEMDTANRNPSRLSRMPGVTRDGQKQFLVGVNLGKPSWVEWRDWVEDTHDNLPDIQPLHFFTEAELAPELIKGVLRQGHKLLLAGPSKAGKSFCLQQLAIAVAHGREWLGFDCMAGNVLYVNLELDPKSNGHRFLKIHQEFGLENNGKIDVWDLRGNSASLDKLTPKLIRRAEKKGKEGYALVIIDPIYKVLTGDENSAEEMAHFCNQFDKIALQMGSSVVYGHHHSKGAQGQKSSRDRSSGSGVFARDPDAIIDLIELSIDEARRKRIVEVWEREAIKAELQRVAPEALDELGPDGQQSLVECHNYAVNNKVAMDWDRVREAKKKAAITTAWRLEGTLREFASFEQKSVFFRYPLHVQDEHELLFGAKADGEENPYEKFKKKRDKGNESSKDEANEKWENAFEMNRTKDGHVHKKALAEAVGLSEDAAYKWAKKHKDFDIKQGLIFRQNEG